MSTLKLSGLVAPVTALVALDAKFSHLPAPCVGMSPIFPERLELSFHDNPAVDAFGAFSAFEAWREALNLDPTKVVHHVQRDGRTRVLKVHGQFAGADVELTGFTQIPDLEPVETGSGAVS
ncbi:hypothetical protein [Streptomyces sp. NPDC048057]|uniref:hypothetical protein n=1 Tax=Streptomyces sp. NPDC048057 TaxID=3155628 RepID=UPI0033E39F11